MVKSRHCEKKGKSPSSGRKVIRMKGKGKNVFFVVTFNWGRKELVRSTCLVSCLLCVAPLSSSSLIFGLGRKRDYPSSIFVNSRKLQLVSLTQLECLGIMEFMVQFQVQCACLVLNTLLKRARSIYAYS
jgi:hypothetical protein